MKNTVATIMKQKSVHDRIAMLTAYDYSTARLIDEAGVEMILVGDSLGMVMLGYEDMPFMSYQTSVYDAVFNAGRLMKEGRANAVKLEGGKEFSDHIKAITEASIPVVAHIGMTPQSVNMFGGFKVQGKNIEAAKKIISDARAVESAGACAVVMECVPDKLAEYITDILKIPTIGIGAGTGCDGQVLVYQDMLGMYSDFTPKFVKKYGNIGETMKDAFKKYISDIKSGVFPSDENSFKMSEDIDFKQLEKEC